MNDASTQQLLHTLTQLLVDTGHYTQDLAQYCHSLEEQVSVLTSTPRDIPPSSQELDILKSPQKAKAILEASTDGMALFSAGHCTDVNAAQLQLFGYPDPEALLGQPWQMLFSTADIQWLETEAWPLLLQNQHWQGELYAQRQDGEVFIAHVTFALTDPDQMVCICRDITAQVRMASWQDIQTTLLKQLATGIPTTEVLETMMDGLECHLMDSKGAILLVEAGEKLCPYIAPNLPPTYVVGMDGLDIGPDQGASSTAAYTKKPVIATDLMTDSRWQPFHQLSSGYGFQACWSFPLLDDQAQILGVMAIYLKTSRVPTAVERQWIDVAADLAGIALERDRVQHQQQQAQRNKVHTQAELQAIFDAYPDLLLRLDKKGTILSCNASQAYGDSFPAPEQILGQSLQTVFPPEIYEPIRSAMVETLKSNQRQEIEYAHTLTGDPQYFEARLLPAEDEQIWVLVRDICDRKRAELALAGLFRGTSGVQGADFFPILVQEIATTLKMSAVMISHLSGTDLETLAFYAEGEIQPNRSSAIANTPTEITLREGSYRCIQQVQASFPADQLLVTLNAEGYLGFVLRNTAGETLGVLSCFSQSPLQSVDFTYSVLQIFGARAAAELERWQAVTVQSQLQDKLNKGLRSRTQALRQSIRDLRIILNTAYDGIYIHDHHGQLIDVNQRTLDIHGLNRDQILSLNMAELMVADASLPFQERCRQAHQGISQQLELQVKHFQSSSQSITAELRIRPLTFNGKSVLISTLSDISSRKQQQQALQLIVEGTADKTGADFYRACVQHLVEIFQVRYAFVAQLRDDTITQMRMLALWNGKQFVTPYDIDLAGTPYFETYQQEWSIVPRALQTQFPHASEITQLGGESYIGVTFKNSQGKILGNLGIIDTQPLPLDISNLEFVLQLLATRVGAEMDRQTTEDALRQSQQQLQTFINNSLAAISIKDLKGKYLVFNQVLENMFNIDSQRILGKTDHDLFSSPIAKILWENEANILAQGQPQTIEEVITHADGSRHTYIANKFPLFDAQGQPYALGSIATDISDRKHTEEKLQESQQLLRLVIDNIPQLIYWKDHDSVYLGCNKNFAVSVGLKAPEQVLGKTDAELVATDKIPAAYRHDDPHILATGEPQIHHIHISHTEDGTQIWADINKIPLHDIFGNTVGMLGTYEDISDRKIAEQSLTQQAEKLEQSLLTLNSTQAELKHNELFMRQQAAALVKLSQLNNNAGNDLACHLQELTEITAETLNVDRVSVWLLDKDQIKVSCINLFDKTSGDHSQGMEILREDYPHYFTAITNEPILAASDASIHPVMYELSETFLKPLNIGAKLDSSFQVEEECVGVICCEHLGSPRSWHQSEQTFIRSVANLISLFLEVNKRQHQALALEQVLNELTESKQLLELVFDTLPQRVFWKDRDSCYLGCNKLFLEDAGLDTLEQIIGKTDYDLPWPEQADSFRTDDALVMTTGIPRINYEEEQNRLDGSTSWLRTSKIPICNSKKEIIGIFGSYEDITQLKEAEQSLMRANEELEHRVTQRTRELQNSQQLLQLVMDTIPQSIFWKDCEYRFLGCNQSFLTTTGLTSIEELMGKTDYDMPWKAEADWYRQHDSQIMATQVPELGLVEPLPQPNGQTIWLETNKAPLYDAHGDLIGILGTFHDITQHKQSEEALKNLNNALQIAKEAADAANRAKSEFLANMSHELRTPLNGILGFAQILKRDAHFLPHHAKSLDIIHQSGTHLLTLINDILDIAKIEANKLELDPIDIHLPQFLENIVDIIDMGTREKELQFIYQPVHQLPQRLKADEKRLRQVLLNLLSNAVKFTDQGQVTFIVTVEQEEAHQIILRFSITDTGIGIAPQHMDQIFRPFEQVGELHRRAEGTGLGLSITRELIELMGGTLQVKSHIGQGSTFWFTVPFLIPSGQTTTNTMVGSIVSYTGPRRQLLIVEDNSVNRLVIISILEPLGFDLVVVEDSQLALKQALQSRPDLILTDLVMPNKDGVTLIQEMRQMSELQSIPIIAMSASVQELNQQKSQDAGCNGFIPKPIDELQLYAVLEQYLELEWVFASPSQSTELRQPSVSQALVIPDLEIIQALYDLARLGNMTQLQQDAHDLAISNQQFAPFANRLIALACQFEDEKIMAWLQPYLPDHESI